MLNGHMVCVPIYTNVTWVIMIVTTTPHVATRLTPTFVHVIEASREMGRPLVKERKCNFTYLNTCVIIIIIVFPIEGGGTMV